MGQITKVTPDMIQVANNVTSRTVGNTNQSITLTFDQNGVITAASNSSINISGANIFANTITGNKIAPNQITGNLVASNTVSNTNIQTGAIEAYSSSRSTGLFDGMRNRIINGAMVIDQRNAGASVTITTLNGQYTVDRWNVTTNQASKVSVQQSTVAPAGFVNSALITSLSAFSPAAIDYLGFVQNIEGVNIADLGWGTANAKTLTLSFWVRSSITGTYTVSFTNSANARSYVATYTISAANTWEQKSVTIAGDTTGTWLTNTSNGVRVWFDLGSGSNFNQASPNSWTSSNTLRTSDSVSLAGTNGATFYITGVQLEVGSTATSFDYRPYGTELQLCQRYCNVYGGDIYSVFGTMGFGFSTTGFSSVTVFPVEMRAVPTVSYTGNTRAVSGSSSDAVTSVTFNNSNSSRKIALVEPTSSSLTVNRGYFWSANNDATARAIFSAEL